MRYALMLAAIVQASQCLPRSPQQQYFFGAWSTAAQDKLMAAARPLLETYLTQEIGPLYDPPISFKLVPFDYDETNALPAMVEAGKLDFAFTMGGGLTCMEAQYGYTILGTLVSWSLGQANLARGSVIFSLKSNQAINNISDFRGKRIGVGHPWSAGSYQLPVMFLNSVGMNIFTEFAQVVFFNFDDTSLINALLMEKIDVAVTQSGTLEASYAQQMPQLRIHNLQNASFQGTPYPFATSTILTPNNGIAVAPHVPLLLRQQVSDALVRLNQTIPAARGAGMVNIVPPLSYEMFRTIVEELGMLITTPTGKVRADIFEGGQNFVSCPRGYSLERPEALNNGCRRSELDCPTGFQCYCRPCHPDIAVTIFPWQTVLALCYTLFLSVLFLSVGWTCFLYTAHGISRIVRGLRPMRDGDLSRFLRLQGKGTSTASNLKAGKPCTFEV